METINPLFESFVERAIRAYSWSSFNPERSGKLFINEMSDYYDNFISQIPEHAKSYCSTKFLSLVSSWISAKSRCASSAVTGGSNFPVKRQQKYSNWEHGHSVEFYAWCEKTIKRLNRPVKLTIDEEIARLENKLEDLENLQDLMKRANKIVRSKISDIEKVEELQNIGCTEIQAKTILIPDFLNRIGFASYLLTNNNAKIKDTSSRLEKLIQAASTANSETELNGVRIVENPRENRLQLFFDGKPSEPTRTSLKSNGFRWSPTNGCWQSYLNQTQMVRANSIISIIQ